MSRNVFSKQTTNRIIIFAIKVNIFLDAMKVVKFCTTSTIKHSTRDHLKKKKLRYNHTAHSGWTVIRSQ